RRTRIARRGPIARFPFATATRGALSRVTRLSAPEPNDVGPEPGGRAELDARSDGHGAARGCDDARRNSGSGHARANGTARSRTRPLGVARGADANHCEQ